MHGLHRQEYLVALKSIPTQAMSTLMVLIWKKDAMIRHKQLKPPEAALLNWAVGLMADVVEEEDSNKKTAGNIAVDFAPNMTQIDIISQSKGCEEGTNDDVLMIDKLEESVLTKQSSGSLLNILDRSVPNMLRKMLCLQILTCSFPSWLLL
ncbi:hypothetical protein NC653_007175 [Populus alba x Populus x berolinensis]|uniref:Uncharacterized protein n=1 Tax=Populus alba x Populus x berolinensis TaxID=444605 RepID=A0AAD6WFD6_9ROSI|nr:hypothetical protein NC653_007175 [Populus alba x Populus x berolinensis]